MADSGIYESPLSSANIEGVEWHVSAVDNGHQAIATPLPGTSLSLKFSRGSVSGSSGCNRFHGPYLEDRQPCHTRSYGRDPKGLSG